MQSKCYFLLIALATMGFSAFATSHTISVGGTSGMSFVPTTLTVHPGDSVIWVWGNGTHTTTSTASIPSGATSWNANINSTATTFVYVPTTVGTYNYQCNFHVSMGMIGSFTVVSATDVPTVSPAPVFSIYPDPANNVLHVSLQDASPATLSLTDMSGKEVLRKSSVTAKDAGLNTAALPAGSYVLSVQQSGNTSQQQVQVTH